LTEKSSEQGETRKGVWERGVFFKRAGAILLLALFLLFLWHAVHILLLVFGGILLAILLRSVSDFVAEHTGLSEGISLLAVLASMLVVVLLAAWLVAPMVIEQFYQLSEKLPQAAAELSARIRQHNLGKLLFKQVEAATDPDGGEVVERLPQVFSATIHSVISFVLILVVGLYLSIAPRLYVEGVIHLVPVRRRTRAREVIRELGSTLRWWLFGQLCSMVAVGALTTAGLLLLGIPLAVGLGVVAGFLEFIPTVGPILAAVPALLLAAMEGPEKALYVLMLYMVIQWLESYLIQPMVQQRTVHLPPVITILSIFLLGTWLGFFGVLLATPLAACFIVLVKMLYVQDALGDESVEVDMSAAASQKHKTPLGPPAPKPEPRSPP
jgi:predicted PurR-regulated permease PerM